MGPTTLALFVLTALWLGPLPELAQHSFAAHMTMHMGVVAIAAPLLALGFAGGRLDPVRRWPRIFSPVPASLLELWVVWSWHAPALHHAARSSLFARSVEQGSFLLSGLALWMSVFGGDPTQRAARAGTGVLALLLTSMHMTLLGALLALPLRPLYAHPGAHSSAASLADQQLGGAIMLVVGGVVYLAGGVWLAAGLLRSTSHGDAGGGRPL